jgi:hypothetical protein
VPLVGHAAKFALSRYCVQPRNPAPLHIDTRARALLRRQTLVDWLFHAPGIAGLVHQNRGAEYGLHPAVIAGFSRAHQWQAVRLYAIYCTNSASLALALTVVDAHLTLRIFEQARYRPLRVLEAPLQTRWYLQQHAVRGRRL